MSKYTLTIEGDFEKGDCWECPLAANTYVIDGNYYPQCPLEKDEVTCPLEEVVVAENATTEGKREWISFAERMCPVCGAILFRDFKSVNWEFPNTCPKCGHEEKGGK